MLSIRVSLLSIVFYLLHLNYILCEVDYYKILGVKRNASTREIKREYHNLSKLHHPDLGGSKKKFLKIRDAYEVLSNPETRKLYDAYGEAGLDPNFQKQQSQTYYYHPYAGRSQGQTTYYTFHSGDGDDIPFIFSQMFDQGGFPFFTTKTYSNQRQRA